MLAEEIRSTYAGSVSRNAFEAGSRVAGAGFVRFPDRLACIAGLLLTVATALSTAVEAATPPAPPRRADVERVLAEARDHGRGDATERPLRIVLLADRKDHGPGEHDYPRWQARWGLLLGGTAASREPAANLHGPDRPDPALARGAPNVDVALAQGWPSAGQWKDAATIVAFCYLDWTPERIVEMGRHLDHGGGLVVIHSAAWTRPRPSADVAAVLGFGGFRQWRHGPVSIETIRPGHPICLGLPRLLTLEDESYWPPTPTNDGNAVEVLAGSRERSGTGEIAATLQPMFWTHVRGQGRVFGCIPGHCSWTFDDPFFRLWLLRGIAWSAQADPYRLDELALRSAAVSDD